MVCKRVLAVLLLGTSALGLSGCLGESSYENRLNRTLEDLKFQRQLDANLNPADTGRLKELNLFVRPPRGMAKAQAPGINVPPGSYDVVETFLGQVDAQGTPIQLQVLGRVKQPPRTGQPKPGDPPPPPETNLATFEGDVRGLLNAVYGGGGDTKSEVVNERGRQYKRIKFQAADGQFVSANLHEQPNQKLALIFVYPAPAANSQAVTTAIPLALGSVAVGPKAAAAFSGRPEAEASGGADLGF